MGCFVAVFGLGSRQKKCPVSKICYPYPTRMKSYLKKIQNIHKLNSAYINTFPSEISNFYYIKKYRCRLKLIHNL